MRSILILKKTWELWHVLEGDFIKFGLIFSHFSWIYFCFQRKREEKCEMRVQEVQVRVKVERGGEAIFGLYLFLKKKEEGKLEECSKRLWYGYLSKFGYGFTHLLVRNPSNSLFDCVWIGKTIIQYIYICLS